ncbi:MAG: MBL fold metallo-hydrolase [Anaerolineales bacterium]|nr:MBL fold metallo-hydrolase [Anaerolineales bacterium]
MTGPISVQIDRIPLRLSNAYLIRGDDISILIDAGMPGEAARLLETIKQHGNPRLDWIFLTHAHFDHFGSATQLKRATGAKVLIQKDDAPALMAGETLLGEVRGRGRLTARVLPLIERLFPVEPMAPDVVFDQDYTFPGSRLKIRAMHTPGHTTGSSSIVIENTHLFAGDLVSTNGAAHAQRYYAHDWEALSISLAAIKSLKPTHTYPGHGPDLLTLEALLQLSI